MPLKEVIPNTNTQEEVEESDPVELEFPSQDNSTTYDPWDFLGSDMYTYSKLTSAFASLDSNVTEKLTSGELQIPKVVFALIDYESVHNTTSVDSLFNFPNGKIAVHAKEIYGEQEHYEAYKFISHLMFTNLFFNIKEIFYLRNSSGNDPSNWIWDIVTDKTLIEFKNTPNQFVILKLDVTSETKEVMQALGFDISRTGVPSHENHSTPESQYMILSTEDIADTEYYKLEPESRGTEPDVIFNTAFLNAIDNFSPLGDRYPTYSHTNAMSSPDEFYSYKQKEPNSDIFIEVDDGDLDV
jgi:hypothetical protein